MQWYYAEDGEQKGPFNDSDFIKLVDNGTVKSNTLVWNETMTDWQSLRSVRKVLNDIPRESSTKDFAGSDDLDNDAELNATAENVSSEGGMVSNAELTARARDALEGKWLVAVVFTLLYTIIMQAFQGVAQFPVLGLTLLKSPVASTAGSLFTVLFLYVFVGVFQLGISRFYLDLVRNEVQGVARLFYGFKYFWKASGAYLLMMLIIFLWMLLLIIPGIMAALSYAMVFYILADDPEIDISEALTRSKAMMYGNRMKLFLLSCRFIGWTLLGILTCGVGLLWVQPYMLTSFALFYEDVRGMH